MHLHLLANRQRLGVSGVVVQQRDVRGWRRWRRAEHVVEQPPAAQDRRRTVRIGSHGEDTALTEQAAPYAVAEGDSPEVASVHVRDPIVAREPLIDERIVRRQQIDDAAVLAQLRGDEQSRLLTERLTEVLVEVGIGVDVRHDASELSYGEP